MPIYNLCRICLTEDVNLENMHPLFDDENEECSEIVRKIEECGGIKLQLLEDFPSMLCYQCLESLNISYKFRVLCQASENAFFETVVKSELKIEPGDSRHNQVEVDDEIIFDLQTEFIDAEVDIAEITNANDNYQVENEVEEDFEIETADHSGVESACDYLTEASEDSDYKPVEKAKPRAKIIKNKRGKRGRPRSNETSGSGVIKRSKLIKLCGTARGRKPTEEPQTSIMCEICGNIYAKRGALNMHMRRHMADKPFECEICGKTFAGPSELNRHIRVHTGEKPFVCKFCGRSFADRSSNIRHERTHTNERPFSCSTCGKSFSYSNVLKNHMLTHTGEKPFPCEPCNKTFSRKHQLEQHFGTLTHQQTIRSGLNCSMSEFECVDE